MTRPHAEVEAERRLILGILAGAGQDGLSAPELAELMGRPQHRLYAQLTKLERDGLIRQLEKKRKCGGRWCRLYVRVTP